MTVPESKYDRAYDPLTPREEVMVPIGSYCDTEADVLADIKRHGYSSKTS